MLISIHALLAESDAKRLMQQDLTIKFLSTLSLRRATLAPKQNATEQRNFYPRSPCGERPSDQSIASGQYLFLSTLSLRRATRTAVTRAVQFLFLSTLSLRRATCRRAAYPIGKGFLSTLSLRRATFGTTRIRRRICNFYPRSPCGERREPTAFRTPHHIFLSTLSLRRATVFAGVLSHDSRISIHALLAESDADKHDQSPRRPRISIHALLAESDARFRYWVLSNAISIHALLAESD